MYQDSDHQSPMSLEDQCYLYLILHLEKFLPKEISLLPLRERQRLLVNLPAADVCQLEETSVVEGVCVNEVWKEIGQRQIKHYPYKYVCESTLEKLQRGEGYRDHFHEVVSHTVIWQKYLGNIAVPFLLYTVVDCLGISDWQSRGIVPIKVDSRYYPAVVAVLPPRYDQQFGNSSASMLFSCFKMLPRKMTTGKYSSQYAMESGATLRLLLSEVEELCLWSDGTRAGTLCGLLRRDTPEISLSNSLVQCCGSKLNIVSVKLDDRSYRYIYMQEDTRYGHIETIPTERLSYSTFVMVKKLVVSLQYYFDDKCMGALLKDLAMAVKYQLKLEDLLIELPSNGWLPDNSWIADLLSTLTEFVCRKTFRKFVLQAHGTGSVLEVDLYEKLLAPFSCAAPQQNRQVIEFHGLNITSGEEGIRVPLGHDITAPRLRSVSFHDCSQVSESFLKRLLSLDIEIQVSHQQSIGRKRKIYDD